MNRVQQPHTLFVLELNAGMSTAAGADELVEIPSQNSLSRTKANAHLLGFLEESSDDNTSVSKKT